MLNYYVVLRDGGGFLPRAAQGLHGVISCVSPSDFFWMSH